MRSSTAEFNEVKEIGRIDSTTRTADQTTATSGSRARKLGWSKIANIISINENYDLHETARLLALVNMSMCDGFISGWYWKRVHAFWRPVTAIHEADTDGNPDTIQGELELASADSRLAGLPVDPQRPRAAPASEVIGRFTGTDNHSFCFVSTTSVPAGSQRCYTSCRKPAKRMPTRAWWSASTSEPPSNRASGSAKRSASTPSSTTSGRWMTTRATRTPTLTNIQGYFEKLVALAQHADTPRLEIAPAQAFLGQR